MNATLRPMNLGEILDRTFQIYRSRFWVFVGFAAFPSLGMRALSQIDATWVHLSSLLPAHTTSAGMLRSAIIGIVFYHFSSFFRMLISPAHIKLASRSVLNTRTSFRDAFDFFAARWRSYLWIAFLKLLATLIVSELLASGIVLCEAWFDDATGAFNNVFGLTALLIVLVPATLAFLLFLGSMPACRSLFRRPHWSN